MLDESAMQVLVQEVEPEGKRERNNQEVRKWPTILGGPRVRLATRASYLNASVTCSRFDGGGGGRLEGYTDCQSGRRWI